MATQLLKLDQAKPLLKPLLKPLIDSYWKASEHLLTLSASDPLFARATSSSSRASLLYEFFNHSVRQQMSDLRVRWCEKGRLEFGIVQETLGIRFKKLTEQLIPRNIHTEAQRRMYHQEPVLDNARPITWVTFGYTTARESGVTTGLYFVATSTWEDLLWHWRVYGDDCGQLNFFDGPTRDQPAALAAEQQFTLKIRKPKEA